MKLELSEKELALLDIATWKMIHQGYEMLNYASLKGSTVTKEQADLLDRDIKDLSLLRRRIQQLMGEKEA